MEPGPRGPGEVRQEPGVLGTLLEVAGKDSLEKGKLSMLVHTRYSREETGGLEVQGQPELYAEFKVVQGYMRTCLILPATKKGKKKKEKK